MSGPTDKFVIEPERYEFRAAAIHQFDLARRDFFKILGAGIAVLQSRKMRQPRRKRLPAIAVSKCKTCPRKSMRGCTSAKTAQ